MQRLNLHGLGSHLNGSPILEIFLACDAGQVAVPTGVSNLATLIPDGEGAGLLIASRPSMGTRRAGQAMLPLPKPQCAVQDIFFDRHPAIVGGWKNQSKDL
jgi:hypothetical protein